VTQHDAAVAEMKELTRAICPVASGLFFFPNEDELDHAWEDYDSEGNAQDYYAAWLDKGALPRVPFFVFTDNDPPDNGFDIDDDEHYESGEPYDRAEFAARLTELSKHLDRNRVGFEAIGEYAISVWFDTEPEV